MLKVSVEGLRVPRVTAGDETHGSSGLHQSNDECQLLLLPIQIQRRV